MKSMLKICGISLPALKSGLVISGLLCLGLVFSGQAALAEEVVLDEAELACLECHDKDDAKLKMKTEKGEILSLKI